MCMECVGAVATGFNAATLIGGPILAHHWQRIRAVFGLEDNSVAAVEARELQAAGVAAPVPAAPADGRADRLPGDAALVSERAEPGRRAWPPELDARGALSKPAVP